MAGLRPQFGHRRRIEPRAIGHHDLGLHAPVLEVLEEPAHVIVVVALDQGEGHGKILGRVGGQQQGITAQMKFIDAECAAEAVQDARLPPIPISGAEAAPRGCTRCASREHKIIE